MESDGLGEDDASVAKDEGKRNDVRLEVGDRAVGTEDGTVKISELEMDVAMDSSMPVGVGRGINDDVIAKLMVGGMEKDGSREVVVTVVRLGVNALIDKVSSEVDIGMSRPSNVDVTVGVIKSSGLDVNGSIMTSMLVDSITNEVGDISRVEMPGVTVDVDIITLLDGSISDDIVRMSNDSVGKTLLVKIGSNMELVSGKMDRGVNMLIDRDSSDVGKGIRKCVVLGATVVMAPSMSEVDARSVVIGSNSRISQYARENRKVSVGTAWRELSTDGETWTSGREEADVSTSIVEAILKDNLDVVGDGVMIITAAVDSLISWSMGLLLIIRKGILVCISFTSTEEKVIDDDTDERYEVDTIEFLGMGKGVVCGPANVLNGILVGILVFRDADVAPCSIELLG